MGEDVIRIDNLYKSFKEVKAVQDLSFRVKQGELFAFLGVNGAGKSTTISILCGLLKKDSGKVVVSGVDLDTDGNGKISRDIGVVFQNTALDRALTARENLLSRAALYGITGAAFEEKYEKFSKLFGLEELKKRPVGKLSGGQRRRVDIARALFHDPKILILDEPTTGLDPQTRKSIWEIIATLRKTEGLTVFLTTHYMEEAAEADYVVILDKGQIAAEGTPVELKNKYTGDYITLYGVGEEAVSKLGGKYEKVVGGYRIEVKDTAAATGFVVKYPELFTDYEIVKGKMDDVFLAVTGTKPTGGDEDEAAANEGRKHK